METQHYLDELWNLFLSRNDRSSLLQYLEEFTKVFEKLLSQNSFEAITHEKTNRVYSNQCFTVQSNGLVTLDHFPTQLLQVVNQQLLMLLHLSIELKLSDIRLATYLVECLIIVSRTRPAVLERLSESLVSSILMIATQVLNIIKEKKFEEIDDCKNLDMFLFETFYFLECLYDPLSTWRSILKEKTNPSSSINLPLLNAEVIPFFCDSLQLHSSDLDISIQQQLLRMFGSILSGYQKNALLATSPATLDVLTKYLSHCMHKNKQSDNGNDTSQNADSETVRLVVKLFVTMLHTLHNSAREHCQMDVKTVIKEYLNILSETCSNPDIQLQLIGFIPEILNTKDKATLQMVLLQNNCLQHLKDVLLNFREKSDDNCEVTERFAVHFTNIINCLVAGSMSAKDMFSRDIGTSFILSNFKEMCLPSKDVLFALLSMGVESGEVLSNPEPIKNVFIILMLFDWLPHIKQVEQQKWLSHTLTSLFMHCISNKIIAGHCKLVKKVIGLLIDHPTLHQGTVLNLIQLLEILGSYSMSSRQTLMFMELLRQDSSNHQHLNKYFDVLMNSLSVMAHKELSDRKPSYFFDLQDETSGLTAPSIQKWGGSGFSLHCWVCLEYLPHRKNYRKRRQLYSFTDDHGVGIEGFFTADCHLALSVITKKNYFTVKLNEYPFVDNKWHCVQILHVSERKFFSSNGTIMVYIDNVLQLSTALRFPSLSSFTQCHIGSPGNRTNAHPSPDAIKSFFKESPSEATDRVVVIDNGSQDDVWGQATSLLGQLGPVIIFNDTLKEAQLNTLYETGLDMWKNSRSSEYPFDDIPSSKVVLYYEAKGCYRHVCKDLSRNPQPRHGTFTGHKIYTWDIKDTINCIGGISVLMPLLDIIHMRYNSVSDPKLNETEIIEEKAQLKRSDSVMSTRISAVKNPLANFVCVLASFIAGSNHVTGCHGTNAELMVKCSTASTIGALIQKMPTVMLNESLLWSIQFFTNTVSEIKSDGNFLLMDIYQYLLFDFRLWCLSDASTQYAHVQYISTLIKEKKKSFRMTFGVQYLLDVIKTFYSSSNGEVSEDDVKTIRCSLLGLIKFYVTDDITSVELSAIFNFVSAAKSNDAQICEAFDIVESLLKCKSRDQLVTFLCDPKYANYFYSFFCIPDYNDAVRIRIAKLLLHVLHSHRALEKHKQFLKQANVGFSGIFWIMKETVVSDKLAHVIVNTFKRTDIDGAMFIGLANLLCEANLNTKRNLCEHFLTLAYSKASFLQDCAKQKAWQDVVTKLFIKTASAHESNQSNHSSISTLTTLDDEVEGQLINLDIPSSPPPLALSSPKSTSNEVFGDFSNQSVPNGVTTEADEFVLVDHHDARMGKDLVELAVESVFLLLWRGVGGSNSSSWKERGQVFTCLNRVASSHDLLLDLDDIKAKLLEQCVEAALQDIRECSVNDYVKATGLTFSMANENCAELVRLIFDFLMTDGMHKASLWTEKLMENLFALYEALSVWGINSDIARDTEWSELASIGLRLLCGCIDGGRLGLVAMASAKLHNLVHSREPSSTEEVCFLFYSLHLAMSKSIESDNDVKEYVITLIRDLLDKNFKRLDMGKHLSGLPPTTGSSSFFDDFLLYCVSSEWVHFIKACVKPKAENYLQSFSDITTMMTVFWTDTTEQFMQTFHQREREKGDTKLRFRANIEADFYKERSAEEERQNKNVKSLRNQNISVLRQWRATKRFLMSERGFWRERTPNTTYWKLSSAENFSRMRLKLTENYNFDRHEDASRLRDNLSLDDIKEKPQEAIVPPSAILSSSDASKEDDSVGDEDWNMLASHPGSSGDESSAKEKMVVSKECELITLMDVVSGKLEVTTTHVYFYDKSTEEEGDSGMDFKWSLSQLREVHLRRYNLRKSALELFLVDQTNYFINFAEHTTKLAVYKALLGVRPPNLLYYGMRTPQTLLKASNLTQKWVQREISNFDYLMQLNTIAGRTYNDLSQYPVFPWVLQDYTSEKLDLDDPASFRDLSRPVGILNPKNEEEVRDRFEQFEDPAGVISKFHYGSHYSNAATVLFYMLRMEPFTTLHIQLQGGRFDLSDRQFHSLAATFQTIMETTNDVKELIPEFFYMPEFLVNSNRFDLGKLQFSKDTVDDVILPKWAKSSNDFIFQHRKALESEYVSSHLHHWIDLIFGYKQRGEEAVKSCNVFYYCTYEGAVDLDAIADPIHRKAVEGMINNFGQTPTQLLTDPHPKRMTKEEAAKKVLGSRLMSTLNVADERCPTVLEQPEQLKAFFVEVMTNHKALVYVTVPKNQSHSFIQSLQSGMPDSMITVSENGVIGTHGWLPYDKSITNYFTFEKDITVDNNKLMKQVKGYFSPGLRLSAHLFLVSHDAKYLFVAGFWDNSIRVMTTRGRPVCSLLKHFDVVTCLSHDHGGSYLMSGSYDTTCIIWKIIYSSGLSGNIGAQPLHVLYGHHEVVTCVLINSELDVALSSSKDGTCIVHSVRKGHYIRTIRPFTNNPELYTVPSICLSSEGKIILYARSKKDAGEEKQFLHLYSINGKHLALDCLETRLGHMTVCGEHLVTGDIKGLLVVRELVGFSEISCLQLFRPITCIHVTKSMTHILACLRDGKLIVVGVDRPAKSRSLFKSTS